MFEFVTLLIIFTILICIIILLYASCMNYHKIIEEKNHIIEDNINDYSKLLKNYKSQMEEIEKLFTIIENLKKEKGEKNDK